MILRTWCGSRVECSGRYHRWALGWFRFLCRTLWPVILGFVAGLLFAGCASQRIVLVEEKPDGSHKRSEITTRTFWDAQSALAKTKTSNAEKTQSIGTDGAESQSTSSNTVQSLDTIARILGK